LTKSFVVLIRGNSKSFHLGVQSTFNPWPVGTPTRPPAMRAGGAVSFPAGHGALQFQLKGKVTPLGHCSGAPIGAV